MLATRFRPSIPSARWAAAADWLAFGVVLAAAVGTAVGRSRATGPTVALAATAAAGLLRRRPVAPQLVALVVALAAAWVAKSRPAADPPVPAVARVLLVAGMGLAVAFAVPRAMTGRLRRLGERIRANPGGPTAWAAAGLLVAVPAGLLFWNTNPHVWTGDSMPVVPTVVRTLTAGSRDLTPFVNAPGRWQLVGDRPYFTRGSPTAAGLYSVYPAGMEAFAGPAVLVAWAAGADLADDAVHLRVERATAACVSAACLGLFTLIAFRVGPPAGAVATAWLLATGSAFFTTLGVSLWQQGGTTFWMLVALLVEARGRGGWRGLLIQGIACGWAIACRPSAVTFVVPFGLWVLARDWRRGLLLPVASAVALLPWGLLYWGVYRQPFGPAMGFLSETWTPLADVAGVLVSPGRGLFVYQPCLLLLPLALACRGGDHLFPRGWTPFAAAMVGLHVALVGSWRMWWGGTCHGSRLVAEVVPVLAVFVVRPVGVLLGTRWGWAAVAAIGLAGFAVHAPCAYLDAWNWNGLPVPVDEHPERLWDWHRPPFLFPFRGS